MHVNLTRLGLPASEVGNVVGDFFDWPVVETNLALVRAGLEEQQRWQLSIWDAMILAAARASGASLLLSENFNHGQDYDGVVAMNPFLCSHP